MQVTFVYLKVLLETKMKIYNVQCYARRTERNKQSIIYNSVDPPKKVEIRPSPKFKGAESGIQHAKWMLNPFCGKWVKDNRANTQLKVLWKIVQYLSLQLYQEYLTRQTYDIYESCMKKGFYTEPGEYTRYSVPDMGSIDALATAKKVSTYITYDVEFPELAKIQNTETPWYGLHRAVNFFKLLGVSRLNSLNLYHFIINNFRKEYLYKVPFMEYGFRAQYIIPIPWKRIDTNILNILNKIKQNFTTPLVSKHNETPEKCPYPPATFDKQNREELRYIDVFNLGN